MPPEPNLAETAAARRAVVIAGHEGDETAARSALDHPAAPVRHAAIGALERITALTATDLLAGIADQDPSVRMRAAEAAAASGDRIPAGTVGLLALLDDPEPTVVEVAAWAIGERLPAEVGAVEHLSRLATGHTDALVRESAVAALGSLGDPAGLEAVLAATEDKAAVRRRAVVALAAFDGPDVDRALQTALGDRDWQVRQIAEDLTDVGG